MKKKTLTSKSGHVRELTAKSIRSMKSAADVLPKKLQNILPKRKRGERGPQKQPRKILVTKRYMPEIVAYFKATGNGWQSRIDEVLLEYIKKHPKNQEQHKHSKHSKH